MAVSKKSFPEGLVRTGRTLCAPLCAPDGGTCTHRTVGPVHTIVRTLVRTTAFQVTPGAIVRTLKFVHTIVHTIALQPTIHYTHTSYTIHYTPYTHDRLPTSFSATNAQPKPLVSTATGGKVTLGFIGLVTWWHKEGTTMNTTMNTTNTFSLRIALALVLLTPQQTVL